jgi:hypothetical protein
LGSLESAQVILVVVFTGLALMASMKRPDLASLTWAGLFWARQICGWTIQTYRYAVGGLIFLIFMDFLWVFVNFQYLVFSVHQDPLENLHRFCFLISFFNLILKVILSVLIVKNYIKFKEMDILRVFDR